MRQKPHLARGAKDDRSGSVSLAAVAAIAAVGATTYSAVNSSDIAADNRKNIDLNSAAGRKAAAELAQIQHDDTLRQLNERNNEFKAQLGVQAQKAQQTNTMLILGAAGLGYLILKKRK